MNRRERASKRAARRRQRAQSPFLNIPFQQIRNNLAPLELISPEQIDQLHNASMHILEEIGLDFLDDEALDLWNQAGAKVDRIERENECDGVAGLPAVLLGGIELG